MIFIVCAFFSFFISLICYVWYYEMDPSPKIGKRLPSPFGIPIIGNGIQLLTSPKQRNYEILEEIASKFDSPIVGLRFGMNNFAIVSDLYVAKDLMNRDDWSSRVPAKKFIFERSFNKNLGLIWSDGEGWKEIRRYTIRTLRRVGFGKGSNMETSVLDELQQFLVHFDKLRNQNADIVEIKQLFNIPALNLAWTLMAKIRFDYSDQKFIKLLRLIDEQTNAIVPGKSLLQAFPCLRFVPGLTEHDIIMKVHHQLQSMFKKIIDQRKSLGTYINNPEDFIDEFLKEIHVRRNDQNPNYYTEEQLIMVCLDLFFTSSDTTSSALEFGFLYMLLNPQILKKVTDEIRHVIGFDRFPTMLDKAKMPYVEATTLEILRYSSINSLAGRCPNKDSIVNGYFVKRDTAVAILLHKIHFDESLWKKPTEFQPERFLDKDNKIINANQVLAFGYGKRVCLGESLARVSFFLFFTTILQRYQISKSPSHPNLTSDPRAGLTCTPQPFSIKAVLRSSFNSTLEF